MATTARSKRSTINNILSGDSLHRLMIYAQNLEIFQLPLITSSTRGNKERLIQRHLVQMNIAIFIPSWRRIEFLQKNMRQLNVEIIKTIVLHQKLDKTAWLSSQGVLVTIRHAENIICFNEQMGHLWSYFIGIYNNQNPCLKHCMSRHQIRTFFNLSGYTSFLKWNKWNFNNLFWLFEKNSNQTIHIKNNPAKSSTNSMKLLFT